jgi:hypothetical protein
MESNQNDQNEQLEIEYQNEKSVSKEERIARERQKIPVGSGLRARPLRTERHIPAGKPLFD